MRLRWSAYWYVNTANACVAQARGGWTTVLSFAPGEIKITERPLPGETTCTPAQLTDAGVEPDRCRRREVVDPAALHGGRDSRHYIAAATAALHCGRDSRPYIAAATAAHVCGLAPNPRPVSGCQYSANPARKHDAFVVAATALATSVSPHRVAANHAR